MDDTPSSTPPTFEQAMQRLDDIVGRMESNKMPLEEMVDAYEEGMNLLKICRARVEAARRRVELIQARETGQATLTEFDPATAAEPPAEAQKTPAPAKRKPAPRQETAGDSDDITLF